MVFNRSRSQIVVCIRVCAAVYGHYTIYALSKLCVMLSLMRICFHHRFRVRLAVCCYECKQAQKLSPRRWSMCWIEDLRNLSSVDRHEPCGRRRLLLAMTRVLQL
jgi:hypothetical protein